VSFSGRPERKAGSRKFEKVALIRAPRKKNFESSGSACLLGEDLFPIV
jgi:hypothetical protein